MGALLRKAQLIVACQTCQTVPWPPTDPLGTCQLESVCTAGVGAEDGWSGAAPGSRGSDQIALGQLEVAQNDERALHTQAWDTESWGC